MKRADLPAPVVQKLVGSDRAANDLVDVFGRLAFAVNLLFAFVERFGRDERGVTRQKCRRRPADSYGGQGDRVWSNDVCGKVLGQHLRHLLDNGDDEGLWCFPSLRNFGSCLTDRPLRALPEASSCRTRFVQRGPHMRNQAFLDMGLHYQMSYASGGGLRRDTLVNGDENDRRGNISVAQMSDQLQPIHARHPVIDNEAVARAG